MKRNTKNIALGAIIAAVYVVFTAVFKALSVMGVEIRISEALTVLPAYYSCAIPGLFIGCIIANLFSGNIIDVIFGSLATLIGAIGTFKLKKHKILKFLPPILSNSLIVPLVIKYGYGADMNILILMITVFLSEAVSVGVIGFIFEKYILQRIVK